MARVMFEGVPFHLTHRGNQKRAVFDDEADRQLYLDLLRRYATRFGMAIWGYCLMPNHVHVVAVGTRRDSIPKTMGNAHREYSSQRNRLRKLTGHQWANRYFSTAMDDSHLWAAIRYVELNPTRAGLVQEATDYPWSSARSHADGISDPLLAPDRPFPGPIGDWRRWLAGGLEQQTADLIRRNTATGRPTGSEEFVVAIEQRLGRPVRPRPRRPRNGG